MNTDINGQFQFYQEFDVHMSGMFGNCGLMVHNDTTVGEYG